MGDVVLTVKELMRHCHADDNEHDEADIEGFLKSAINYAEQYQNKEYTGKNKEYMSDSTKQAVRLLVSFWFDNRDISANNAVKAVDNKTMQAVNNLLYFERNIKL